MIYCGSCYPLYSFRVHHIVFSPSPSPYLSDSSNDISQYQLRFSVTAEQSYETREPARPHLMCSLSSDSTPSHDTTYASRTAAARPPVRKVRHSTPPPDSVDCVGGLLVNVDPCDEQYPCVHPNTILCCGCPLHYTGHRWRGRPAIPL